MNRCIFIGRLTRDAEVRYSTEGKAVAKFTLAVDRRFHKEGEQTADFISCTAFGKQVEFIEKYIFKGTKVAVEGRWQTGSYKNKDGVTIYTNDCVIDSIEFAESKKESQTESSADGFVNVPDAIVDDLPFN